MSNSQPSSFLAYSLAAIVGFLGMCLVPLVIGILVGLFSFSAIGTFNLLMGS